jgi:hypothetical protein
LCARWIDVIISDAWENTKKPDNLVNGNFVHTERKS